MKMTKPKYNLPFNRYGVIGGLFSYLVFAVWAMFFAVIAAFAVILVLTPFTGTFSPWIAGMPILIACMVAYSRPSPRRSRRLLKKQQRNDRATRIDDRGLKAGIATPFYAISPQVPYTGFENESPLGVPKFNPDYNPHNNPYLEFPAPYEPLNVPQEQLSIEVMRDWRQRKRSGISQRKRSGIPNKKTSLNMISLPKVFQRNTDRETHNPRRSSANQ